MYIIKIYCLILLNIIFFNIYIYLKDILKFYKYFLLIKYALICFILIFYIFYLILYY